MSRAIHCDLAECDAWVDYEFGATYDALGAWIEVAERGQTIGDYCCGWHAAQDLAKRYEPPTEVAL